MKILVTGGAGFIGTNLLLELKKQNHKLVSVDNYSIGTNHIEGVKYISLDVNHIKEIKNDFDLIYHLAGLSRINHHLENLHLLLFQIQKGWSQLLNGLDQTAQKLFTWIIFFSSRSLLIFHIL